MPLESTPSLADKQSTRLSSAKSTTRDESAPPLADATLPSMQQGQAGPPSSFHPSPLAPSLKDNEAAGSAPPSASRDKSTMAAESAPSPNFAAMAATQSNPPAKSSPSMANPTSVPSITAVLITPATNATMTPTTECGLPSATTATTPTTECG
ncbi:hypothetical protein C0995_004384 [Termitomyces sp. Mi166|nr:hypothetical protein C0995_004384 [Termitomyces sp. Mi166\